MTWLGCTRQCMKNWKQHHIQKKSKFLPSCLINGLEYTVENILMSLKPCLNFAWNQKSRWNISKTGSKKKEKLSPLKHFICYQTLIKITISVGRCLKRKTMLLWIEEYISKNFATCKSFGTCKNCILLSKEKHLNVNIGFSKFCSLRPKWRVLDGSKMTHYVCICSAHQNVVLLVNVMDLDLTYKDLIKLTLSSLKYFH